MLVEVLPGVRAHSLRVQSSLSFLKFLQRLHGRMSLPVRYTNALCGSSDQCWPLVERYSMVSAWRHLVAGSWVYLPQCCCLSTALHSTDFEHHEQCLLMVSSLKIVKFLLQWKISSQKKLLIYYWIQKTLFHRVTLHVFWVKKKGRLLLLLCRFLLRAMHRNSSVCLSVGVTSVNQKPRNFSSQCIIKLILCISRSRCNYQSFSGASLR